MTICRDSRLRDDIIRKRNAEELWKLGLSMQMRGAKTFIIHEGRAPFSGIACWSVRWCRIEYVWNRCCWLGLEQSRPATQEIHTVHIIEIRHFSRPNDLHKHHIQYRFSFKMHSPQTIHTQRKQFTKPAQKCLCRQGFRCLINTCPIGGTEQWPVFQPCWFQCTKLREGCSLRERYKVYCGSLKQSIWGNLSMFLRISDMFTFPLRIRAQAKYLRKQRERSMYLQNVQSF